MFFFEWVNPVYNSFHPEMPHCLAKKNRSSARNSISSWDIKPSIRYIITAQCVSWSSFKGDRWKREITKQQNYKKWLL